MNERDMNQSVREWLNGLQGTVEADSRDECLRKAWGQFCSGGLEMFRQALARNDLAPEQVGPRYFLRLPGRSIASADAERHRLLHNIAG